MPVCPPSCFVGRGGFAVTESPLAHSAPSSSFFSSDDCSPFFTSCGIDDLPFLGLLEALFLPDVCPGEATGRRLLLRGRDGFSSPSVSDVGDESLRGRGVVGSLKPFPRNGLTRPNGDSLAGRRCTGSGIITKAAFSLLPTERGGVILYDFGADGGAGISGDKGGNTRKVPVSMDRAG